MTDFTVTIDDKSLLIGIAAAREAHNAAIPETMDDDGDPIEPRPGTLDTDQDYVQWVIERAAESFARQFGTNLVEIDEKINELQTKRAAIVEKGK